MTDEPLGPRSQGTSATYILGRLRNEGRFDLVDAVESGRLSAFAAGEAAGYMKRPPVLGTGSPNQRRKRQHQLRALAGDGTLSELQELWLGPHPTTGSVFSSPQDLREAWERHRDEVMRLWGQGGRRPMGWWQFDTELKYPGYYRERSFLWRHGILGPEEKFEVEHEWRADFEAAHRMGARERREHLEHCDVPPELIERWISERRRRARVQGATSGATSGVTSEKAQEKAPNVASSVGGRGEKNLRVE